MPRTDKSPRLSAVCFYVLKHARNVKWCRVKAQLGCQPRVGFFKIYILLIMKILNNYKLFIRFQDNEYLLSTNIY